MTAMFITFLFSAAVHELVMMVVTRKFRLGQPPLLLSSGTEPILFFRIHCRLYIFMMQVRDTGTICNWGITTRRTRLSTACASTSDRDQPAAFHQTESAVRQRGVLGWDLRWASSALRGVCCLLRGIRECDSRASPKDKVITIITSVPVGGCTSFVPGLMFTDGVDLE